MIAKIVLGAIGMVFGLMGLSAIVGWMFGQRLREAVEAINLSQP